VSPRTKPRIFPTSPPYQETLLAELRDDLLMNTERVPDFRESKAFSRSFNAILTHACRMPLLEH
jgi:hypothetical protein